MYVITKEKLENPEAESISQYVYKVESPGRAPMPKGVLVFRRINTKKFRLGSKKVTPSFNLMIFDLPSLDDKRELRLTLARSLGLKVAPLHYLFPNLDYDSLNYKKIRRPRDIRRNWRNITIIPSLRPADSSTESALREIALQSISPIKERIKRSCELPEKKEKVSKKMSYLKTKLRMLRTKCLVFTQCFGINLEGEYMKAYRLFNAYRKACKI